MALDGASGYPFDHRRRCVQCRHDLGHLRAFLTAGRTAIPSKGPFLAALAEWGDSDFDPPSGGPPGVPECLARGSGY